MKWIFILLSVVSCSTSYSIPKKYRIEYDCKNFYWDSGVKAPTSCEQIRKCINDHDKN